MPGPCGHVEAQFNWNLRSFRPTYLGPLALIAVPVVNDKETNCAVCQRQGREALTFAFMAVLPLAARPFYIQISMRLNNITA